MKKFIVLSFVGLYIIVCPGGAFAQGLEFKASGFIDAQSYWYRNIPTSSDSPGSVFVNSAIFGPIDSNFSNPKKAAFDRTIAYMGSRARLKFEALMGKEVSGTVFFELDSNRSGEIGDGRNRLGAWNADRTGIEVKNMYLDFAIPYLGIPVPMTVRVGLQPLGVRPNMVVYTDGMGITGGINIDPVTIAPLWFKAIEGKDASADDVDVYGLHAFVKIAQFTVGGYGLYYNMNTYPFSNVTLTYGANPTNQADMWWWGVYGDGKLGPADFNFDLVYDRGEVEKKHGAPARDVKYRGWASRLKFDYPWEKFNFGVVGMYASGADTRKTSGRGLPGDLTSSGVQSYRVDSYVAPPGSEEYSAFAEGVGLYYPGWVNSSNTGYMVKHNDQLGRGAIGGSWMAKLYSSYKAAPWYKVTIYGMYIGDTTRHGNTVGNAVKANGTRRDDSTIGWEFALINEINIYKNLKLDIGAGILFAGNALDYKIAGVNSNDSPNNPWIVTSRLTYTF